MCVFVSCNSNPFNRYDERWHPKSANKHIKLVNIKHLITATRSRTFSISFSLPSSHFPRDWIYNSNVGDKWWYQWRGPKHCARITHFSWKFDPFNHFKRFILHPGQTGLLPRVGNSLRFRVIKSYHGFEWNTRSHLSRNIGFLPALIFD